MIKQMIQKIQYWAMLLLVLAFGACTDDLDTGRSGVIDENGMVRLNIQTQVPGLKLTRSIDVNGEAITTLWLVAFNENGNMISRVQATLSNNNVGADGGSANFTVSVPSSTRILHLLANVNMDNFVDADYIGRHENEVIAPMVSSSGNLVYWGRKTFTSVDDLTSFAASSAGQSITLYRNQAQIKYNVTGSGLEVLGWAACNQYAYGTVAPFDASAIGVEGDNPFHFNLDENDKVTTLPEAYNVKATDPREVNHNEAGGDPRYVFETSNPENDQLYVIMRIEKNSDGGKYYKIMLVNDNKIPYQIIRNHQYIINISDVNTSFGVDSFEDAKNAVPANNPWITVDDVIPEVINGDITLRIEGQTTVVYQEEGDKTIEFYYNGSSIPDIQWISNPGVATGSPVVTWDSASGKGSITLHVAKPAESGILEGTLSIREQDGVLSRRVKVLLCKPFEFSPVWISSEIPLLDGENITILFEIPENYPQELLPVQVKFGCDLIDAQTGEENKLDVISEETKYTVPTYTTEGGWGTKEVTMDWNYKYVYTADRTGKHRVNFRTILTNIGSDNGVNNDTEFHIFMEGCAASTNQSLFEQRDLFFAFQSQRQSRYRIMLGNSGTSTTRFSTYAVEGLPPVYGQEFSVPFTLGTLNNDNNDTNYWYQVRENFQTGTKLWVYYNPTLVSFLGDNGVKVETYQTDPYGNTYSEYTPNGATGELKFRTIQPNFDCDIVISAKSKTNYGTFESTPYNPYNLGINDRGYRSASISVSSTGSLDFKPEFSNDGSSFAPATNEEWQLPYGTNQNFYLKIQIPEQAQGKAFQFYLKTGNLTPVLMSDNDGAWMAMDEAEGKGWIYTFKDGLSLTEKTFHFQTNRLAVTETLTLSSGSYIGFNPLSVNLNNMPLKGTLALPEGVTFGANSPFVILERKDGTRIGVFTLPSDDLTNANSTSYSLTLRGEYNLTENDEVTVKFSPINSSDMYSRTYSHLSEIMQDNMQINLNKQ